MAGPAPSRVDREYELEQGISWLPPRTSPGDIQLQLRRILASRVFSSSPLLSEFLKYVVTQTLAGKSGGITQNSIAAKVFRRHHYDATADSAVRVDAGRLRAKLREYYASEGISDTIVIDLAKRRYTPSFTRAAGGCHAVSDRAFRFYAEGRRLWAKWTPDALERARNCFRGALAEEPHYALASTGMAECYCFMALCGFPPSEAMPKAREFALAAIADDAACVEAHAVLAFIESAYDWAWDKAERRFQHATALDSRCLPARFWYGPHLFAVGRAAEALEQTRKAQELDPTSVLVNTHAAGMMYVARRFDRATELLLSMREEAPGFYLVHWYLGLALLETASPDVALESLHRAAELAGDNPSVLASLGYALAIRGNVDAARAFIGRLEQLSERFHVPATDRAIIYSGLGDKGKTSEWMEKAYEERALLLPWLEVWPLFRHFRSDPWCFDLLDRMHLARRIVTQDLGG